mmetsp:Transcript_13731/g.47429  ORF Transcript_13731/g.47429 Transcript_13731/m.47429 type:complete len:238 (+) Transcript_13731:850-1563(+)
MATAASLACAKRFLTSCTTSETHASAVPAGPSICHPTALAPRPSSRLRSSSNTRATNLSESKSRSDTSASPGASGARGRRYHPRDAASASGGVVHSTRCTACSRVKVRAVAAAATWRPRLVSSTGPRARSVPLYALPPSAGRDSSSGVGEKAWPATATPSKHSAVTAKRKAESHKTCFACGRHTRGWRAAQERACTAAAHSALAPSGREPRERSSARRHACFTRGSRECSGVRGLGT